ncbi:GGDEF domain-containing protein [Rhizobium halophytocola]|uniref:diguanylate cyclase n=1 Tax=Rhizobium halophytocola TaxID=735519 RepID=A0ABS4DZ43_9HYPH|nr:GGDEF domain-containing protein [Rhizobium halophytocola]MBP1850961.1 diguanylate cyclase (GGDEF)-like protein [Rhizobium halophytocola]
MPIGRSVVAVMSRSLLAKIFAVSFVSVHLPLIAMLVYLGSMRAAFSDPAFWVLLSATLAGTLFCLGLTWLLLSPLMRLTRAIDDYRQGKPMTSVAAKRGDEVGQLDRKVSELTRELDGLILRLRQEATEDPLTGLANRRALMERGAESLVQKDSLQNVVSLVMFDIDHFKAINDRHGHQIGDRVLVAIGNLLRSHIRPSDFAARMGGEEFVIVLPATGHDDARLIAERLRLLLRDSDIAPLGRGAVTASFGVVTSESGSPELQRLLSLADASLYLAKDGGRDQVVCCTAEPA